MTFAATQDAFAQALLHADRPVPSGITTTRRTGHAARFSVYRNNVFVGLTKALAHRFPVVERIVGPEFFAGMARTYAQAHKPASPLIMTYGDDFPDFIAGFDPAAGLPYLPDIARLEAKWTDAYHAADATPLALQTLAALPPEILLQRRLALHPSAALIQSPHPIGTIWAAHQHESVPPIEGWAAETVLIVRPDMDVHIHILPSGDEPFVAALFAGATLGAAAEAALAHGSDFDFGTTLVGLQRLGTFSRDEELLP